MSLAIRLGFIVLAMTVFLAALVARHVDLRENGTEIILPMEPVDPRDLLLGYYVIIRTPAHELDTRALAGPDADWREGAAIYVTLSEAADGWRPDGAYPERPREGVFLQGRIRSVYTRSDMREVEREDGWTMREPVPGTEHDVLEVVYNLERYYADAETAAALDVMRNEDRLRLIVSVGADGAAVIKGIEIDGEPRYETLF
jgi:uncharacterized membrane-anchored protein